MEYSAVDNGYALWDYWRKHDFHDGRNQLINALERAYLEGKEYGVNLGIDTTNKVKSANKQAPLV